MTHSEMDDLYELYLMGTLEWEQSAEISDHLQRNCEYCLANVRSASAVMASLARLAEQTSPTSGLRDRVLALTGPPPARRSHWPIAFALTSAAAIALLGWGLKEQGRLNNQSNQLQEVMRQRNELRAAIAILSEPDTRTAKFGTTTVEPQGQVFVSQRGGVVFVGRRLPRLAAGKTFEFWLVPSIGKPQSAGLFTNGAEGISVNVLSQSINTDAFSAVAVSIEPDGGSLQPTSKPILVVPLA